MAEITYEIVEHNGGFAYKVGDVFSETFATHRAAHDAAARAAQRQQLGGDNEIIEYQDAAGGWHQEIALADNRPETALEDDLPADVEAHDADGRAMDEDELPDPDRAPLGDLHHRH